MSKYKPGEAGDSSDPAWQCGHQTQSLTLTQPDWLKAGTQGVGWVRGMEVKAIFLSSSVSDKDFLVLTVIWKLPGKMKNCANFVLEGCRVSGTVYLKYLNYTGILGGIFGEKKKIKG